LLFSAFTSSKTIRHRAAKAAGAQVQMPERRLQAVEGAGELLPVSVELFTVKSLAYERLRQRIRTCRAQYPTSPGMAWPMATSAFVADRVGPHYDGVPCEDPSLSSSPPADRAPHIRA
jgi:hypothetical protein